MNWGVRRLVGERATAAGKAAKLMDDRSWPAYRIEHHRPPAPPTILGYCHRADRPPLTLAPYAAQLLDQGETGEVVLINQATEAIVAVRHLLRLPFRV
jgi:hypothetical protein